MSALRSSTPSNVSENISGRVRWSVVARNAPIALSGSHPRNKTCSKTNNKLVSNVFIEDGVHGEKEVTGLRVYLQSPAKYIAVDCRNGQDNRKILALHTYSQH